MRQHSRVWQETQGETEGKTCNKSWIWTGDVAATQHVSQTNGNSRLTITNFNHFPRWILRSYVNPLDSENWVDSLINKSNSCSIVTAWEWQIFCSESVNCVLKGNLIFFFLPLVALWSNVSTSVSTFCLHHAHTQRRLCNWARVCRWWFDAILLVSRQDTYKRANKRQRQWKRRLQA